MDARDRVVSGLLGSAALRFSQPTSGRPGPAHSARLRAWSYSGAWGRDAAIATASQPLRGVPQPLAEFSIDFQITHLEFLKHGLFERRPFVATGQRESRFHRDHQ